MSNTMKGKRREEKRGSNPGANWREVSNG